MSLSMDGLSTYYTSSLNQSQSTSEVQNSLSKDYSSSSDDELMDVCKQFESYLIEQLYKSMQSTVNKDDDEDSMFSTSTLDYFEDMQTQQYASMTTEQGGLGIAQTLYESMKRNYNV